MSDLERASSTTTSGHQYEFTVTCLKFQPYKLRKTYAQILEMEAHVVSLMDQFDLLKRKNSVFSIMSSSQFKTTRSLLPSMKQIQSTTDQNRLFLQRIEDLENFLRDIVTHQELWSEQFFDFFAIPGQCLITLLDEKERYFSQPKSKIYAEAAGISLKHRTDSYRRNTNSRSLSLSQQQRITKSDNSTILVDDLDIQSEETSMKIGDNTSFKVINDYLDKGQVPKMRNSTMLNELIIKE